jgi:cobalt-zinc-cadmium efflux system outer membrane protein
MAFAQQMSVLTRLCSIALLLVARAGYAAAEPARLDLQAVMRRAAELAPSLGPPSAAVRGAREQRDAADVTLPTPPRLEVGVGPRFVKGADDARVEVSLGVWQDISLGGYGSSRRQLAQASSLEADRRLGLAVIDARTAAALAWVEARLARELVRIRSESLANARQIEVLAKARVEGGKARGSELSLASVVAGRADAELLAAEGQQFVADARLRWWVGLKPEAAFELAGELDAADAPFEVHGALRAASGKQPDVLLAAASAERSARAAEAVAASGRPFVSIGPSAVREGTGDWILLARFSVPLPTVNAAALEAAQARSEAWVARARVAEQAAVTGGQIVLALEEREHTRLLRARLRDGVVAPARNAFEQALARYEVGSEDLGIVLQARREALSAEEQWAEAAAEVRRADIRLMRLLALDPRWLGGSP